MSTTINTADARRLEDNFAVFQGVVDIADEFVRGSRLRLAAACAEIAAGCAWRNHPGLFASPRLERVLIELGRRSVPAGATSVARRVSRTPRHVLHVLSKARAMGGDSRFACRWMRADGARAHSVAITSQLGAAVPQTFLDSAAATGGEVHRLDDDSCDPIVRARRLRALAERADFVALHVYPDDVVPLLAFAHNDGLPPVALINHSDHTFWLGVQVSDLVVQLRRSSIPLGARRRHVNPQRLATLPIPLPVPRRTQSRAEAKARLGLDPDAVVLLSVGTEFKYVPAGGTGFLDLVLPVMTAHERAVLLTVGPRDTGAWAVARERTRGRVVPLGRQEDPAPLFEAADVYLDSFPFASPTAALEAGAYGLPLVAYCPYAGDAQVLSPGAPGLDDSVCRLEDANQYVETVSRLIVNADTRQVMGERARQAIEHHHQGSGWLDRLSVVYSVAGEVRPRADGPSEDRFEADRLDVMIDRLYGVDADAVGRMIDTHVRPLPVAARRAILRRMLRVNRSFSFDLFLPTWLATRLSWRPPYWNVIRRSLARSAGERHRAQPCAST